MTATLQAQIVELTSRLTALNVERSKTQRELSAARDTLTSTPDADTISSAVDAVTAASTRLAVLSEAMRDVQEQIAAKEAQIVQIEQQRRQDEFMAELAAISHQSDQQRVDFGSEYADLAALIDQGIARLLDIREQQIATRQDFISKSLDGFPELAKRRAYTEAEKRALDAIADRFKTLLEAQGGKLDVLRGLDSRPFAMYEGLTWLIPTSYSLPNVPRGRELLQLIEAAKVERQRNQPTRIVANSQTVEDW